MSEFDTIPAFVEPVNLSGQVIVSPPLSRRSKARAVMYPIVPSVHCFLRFASSVEVSTCVSHLFTIVATPARIVTSMRSICRAFLSTTDTFSPPVPITAHSSKSSDTIKVSPVVSDISMVDLRKNLRFEENIF